MVTFLFGTIAGMFTYKGLITMKGIVAFFDPRTQILPTKSLPSRIVCLSRGLNKFATCQVTNLTVIGGGMLFHPDHKDQT